MSKKNQGPRDTAKDIMLGLEPSGRGPRRPREGTAQPPPPRKSPPPQTVIVQKPDNSAINDLRNQIRQLQSQNAALLSNEQQARKRLEANQEALNRKIANSASGPSQREIDDLRRQLANTENKMMLMNQEVSSVKGTVDRHTGDLMALNNDVKSRPVVDPSKIASSNQQLDLRLRDLHGQLMDMKRTMDNEITERIRANKTQADSIARLQDYIKQQEASKNDILASLSRKNDLDKDRLNDEARRLNEKIQLITNEVSKNMNEREQRLKDDLTQKYNSVQAAIKSQFDARLDYEDEMKKKWEDRFKNQAEQTEDVKAMLHTDRNKNKEKFQKVNEALASLETHLEKGNKKMDQILGSEIQARKLHEKGLLSKVNEVEDKLANYLTGLTKSIDEARAGHNNVKVPSLDVDALRREMEAISADKNKMSMEGLLKLEEKVSKIQNTLNHDVKDLKRKLEELSDSTSTQFSKLKAQVNKLDTVMNEVEQTQDRIRDKVERQIPNDLNELSAKVDNLKQQMMQRIDQEEEERFNAVKELQDAYTTKNGKPSQINDDAKNLKRDVDECKVAIKKLAESITTVKNVLDKKIYDEVKQREQDVNSLTQRINSLYSPGPR
uniref:Uncharacterized protein n=1 Tax=Acrobeloides nanus TaxID=290746 RepID=A0A914C8I1_9BILA